MRHTGTMLSVGAALVLLGAMACSSDDSGTAGSGGGTAGSGGGTAGSGGGAAGSGGGTAGTGGGAVADCATACVKINAASCPNEDAATCESECNNDIVGSANCATQGSAIVDCVNGIATVTCDSEGDPVFAGCESQLSAWLACSACDASASDNTCEACQKTQCCAQRKAVFGNPDFMALIDCTAPCNDDQACIQPCKDQYPTAFAAYVTLIECMSSSCATDCG